MKVDSQKHIIEFKYVTGQNMLEEVKELFLEYTHSLNVDLTFQDFQAEFRTLPGKYGPPDGVLLLVLVDGKGAGCVALRKISEDICEMKRLYVRDKYRGLGIGRNLINRVIEEAIRLNYHYVRLDTLPTMKSAQGLYETFGFYDIEPYVYNPIKGTRYMELKLKHLKNAGFYILTSESQNKIRHKKIRDKKLVLIKRRIKNEE